MKAIYFYLWNIWPPFLGAGIVVRRIAPDLMSIQTRLKKRPWTSTLIRAQSGGSIFAMTDPIYPAMLMTHLGNEYVVWDQAASVKFVRPGNGELIADFHLVPGDLADIVGRLETEARVLWDKDVLVKNAAGQLVARVKRTILIRKRHAA